MPLRLPTVYTTLASLFLLGFGLLWSSCQAPPKATLTVAAASDLGKVFPAIGEQFTQKTGVPVTFVFGATRLLEIQAQQGAPFDVIAGVNLSIVQNEPNLAPKPFAQGRLAFIYLRQNNACASNLALAMAPLKHVSIANPDHAPFGRAAQQALEHSGLWHKSKAKLVYAKNAQESAALFETKAVEGAFVPASLASGTQGCVLRISPSTHSPLTLSSAVMTPQAPEARSFEAFLQTPSVRNQLKQAEYILPGEALWRP